LFDLFHKLKVSNKATFLTLTYPEDYDNAKASKNDLRALFKRIERLPGTSGISAIWRMEFQERGAPHFHCVFFNLPYIPKEKIQKMWGEIIDCDRPFTRIECIYSQRKLMNYISKYVAKIEGANENEIRPLNPTDEELIDATEPEELSGFNPLTYLSAYAEKFGENIGRVWGYLNKKQLPFAELVEVEYNFIRVEFEPFRRFAVSIYPRIASYLSEGFKLYVASAEAVLKKWRVLTPAEVWLQGECSLT